MASYTITDITARIILLNMGSPIGYAPVCIVKINDSWATTIAAGDTIIVTPAISNQIISYLSEYPCAMSVGGSSSQYTGSVFNSVSYPVNTSATGITTSVTMSGSSTRYIAIKFTFPDTYTLQYISNRSNGRCLPVIILSDGDNIFTYSASSTAWDFTAGTSYNSFNHAASQSGLPYGTTTGYSLFYPNDNVPLSLTSKIALSSLDYQETILPSSDPYDAGGNSDASDSAGTFANTGSDVGLPSLPQVDPSATGFMKAYNPSGTDLNNFASYLWNTLDIGALKSLYSNPMEAVIGLLMIPASPTVGAAQTVNLGNVATTVSMPIITNRFKEIDCGTVTIPEWWGAYLDYSPYTEVSIYLPYVGVQQLDTNEIMGKPVHVVYHIDVLTGALIALLECDGKCIYHFAGNCGVQIPITASSFGGVLQTALSVGMSAIQSIASQAAGNFQSVSEVATSVFSGAKTRVQKSGSLGSAAGFADNQTPFFIIQRPVQCKPEDQNKFSGYPSYITDTLSDLTGYTEIELIQLSDISATDTEREEIDSLLRAGVIL